MPESPAPSYNDAVSASAAGNLAEAEQLCRHIIASGGDVFDAIHLLAFIQLKRGDKDAALASCDRALALRPHWADTLCQRGDILQQLKRFEEALASYERALQCRPDHAIAACNRGVALHAMKRLEQALASYDHALGIRPHFAEAFINRGHVLRELRRPEEALASYDRALQLQPNLAEALCHRGNTLRDLQRFEAALASYDRALALRPQWADAFSHRGDVLQKLNRFEEALASYDRALQLQPDLAIAAANRGIALRELKRSDEALASYDRALALRPQFTEALYNRGNALNDLQRFEEALASFDRALELRPDWVQALCGRGDVLQELERFEEALVSYERALEQQPDHAIAAANRGVALHAVKRHEEALASYDRALGIQPQFADVLYNRGHVLRDLRRFTEALASYDRALELRPEDTVWHFNKALCLLMIGDFERGWQRFGRGRRRLLAQPRWLGSSDLGGRSILLFPEDGFGDTIQFCRYVPLVAQQAAQVILEVQPPLKSLCSTLAGNVSIVSSGEPLPDFELQCPLHGLPFAFGTRLETIPSAIPYLHAPSHAAMRWRERLGAKSRPWIGLAWSGASSLLHDKTRSIPLSSLLPLLDANATFVSLQKDVRPLDAAVLKQRPDLLDFTDEFDDFSDTAAVVANLDLVISIDTSVVHLAGALGKPVWVLLSYVCDWRWLLDREDSPWYPTARLFRQDASWAWDDVIVRVGAALHALQAVARQEAS